MNFFAPNGRKIRGTWVIVLCMFLADLISGEIVGYVMRPLLENAQLEEAINTVANTVTADMTAVMLRALVGQLLCYILAAYFAMCLLERFYAVPQKATKHNA